MQQSRLRELEEQCVQDCAPPCMSSCPAHVDIRQMALSMGKGDFSGGYKILLKTIPFPEIISRTCDQPCQAKCYRETKGGAVQVADLERACVNFSSEPPPSINLLPKKNIRVAIIGGGLSGLTAAFDLAKKGYQISLFEQKKQLGGRLWNFNETQLPPHVIEKEISNITRYGMEVHLESRVRIGEDILEKLAPSI